MEITYAWLNTFCGTEEKIVREQIKAHMDKDKIGRCRCGALKVIVSGDFVNLSYKAKILCRCNAIEREIRGVLQK